MLLFYSISSIKCNAVPKLKLWFLFAPFFSNVGFVYGHVRIRPEIWTALGAFFSPDVSLNLFNCVRFYFLDIYVRIAFRFLISPLLLIGYAFRRLSSWVELSILIGVNELIFSVSLKRHLAGESGYESRFLVVCWLVAWSPWSVIPWSVVMDKGPSRLAFYYVFMSLCLLCQAKSAQCFGLNTPKIRRDGTTT
jgi:hypothetical protein